MILTAVAGFGLFGLRNEPFAPLYYNDAALHHSMVRWAQAQIAEGRIPFDGWYPYLQLGSSHFHHYQSLAHLITAYVSQLTGVHGVFAWMTYLLVALWPLCIFFSARLFGFERRVALASAAVSPLLVSVTSYGYEHSSYLWQGHGLWSQAFGMWMLPLAAALTWRAISGKGKLAWASLSVGLTIAVHFLTGYLALLCVGLFFVVGSSSWLKRAIRASLVGVGSLLVASWVVVPLLIDARWSNRSVLHQNTFWFDSFGAREVLGWLFSGQIYDFGRVPVITLLVALGLGVAFTRARRDGKTRAIVAVWLVSLLLFFGRPTLGPILNLLPGTQDMQLHRYIMGVHLAGIFLAGIALVWLMDFLRAGIAKLLPRIKLVVPAFMSFIVCFFLLLPAFIERAQYDRRAQRSIDLQSAAEQSEGLQLTSLINQAVEAGGGRIYSGTSSNWGENYKVGLVPVSHSLVGHDADSVGFFLRTITSLSADVEAYFDETNPSQYELFNVKYLILPSDQEPAVPARLLARSGRHALRQVATTGYISMIDTAGTIRADRTNLAPRVIPFLSSAELRQNIFPSITFDGIAPEPPTLSSPQAKPPGPPGSVDQELHSPANGSFSARVTANRNSVALLKASFDPRWSVVIDGKKSKPSMIAPSFVGKRIPPGTHQVAFVYEPYAHYGWLFLLGSLTLIALYAAERFFPSLLLSWESETEDAYQSAREELPKVHEETILSKSKKLSLSTLGVAAARLFSSSRLSVIAVPVLLLTLVASLTLVFFGRSVTWNGGCGDDGYHYCLMAKGELGTRPWSRRVLLPWMVRALPISEGQVVDTFLVINLVALASISVGTFILTIKVARSLGAKENRARIAALLAGTLMFLLPYGFRWTTFDPTRVDTFAAAFGVWWLLASSSRRPYMKWVSVAVAFLSVLAREAWLGVIPVMMFAQVFIERSWARVRIAMASLIAMLVATVFVFTRPGLPNEFVDSTPKYVIHWVTYFVADPDKFLWLALFGWGFLPFFLIRTYSTWKPHMLRITSSNNLILPTLVGAVIHLPLAFIGGYEVHRYLYPGAPFLLSLILGAVAVRRRLEIEFALLLAGSIAIWRPFETMDGTIPNYLEFLFPAYVEGGNRLRLWQDLRLSGLPILAWLGLLGWRLGYRKRAITKEG